eukprot:100418-Rhodomonas_salina.2
MINSAEFQTGAAAPGYGAGLSLSGAIPGAAALCVRKYTEKAILSQSGQLLPCSGRRNRCDARVYGGHDLSRRPAMRACLDHLVVSHGELVLGQLRHGQTEKSEHQLPCHDTCTATAVCLSRKRSLQTLPSESESTCFSNSRVMQNCEPSDHNQRPILFRHCTCALKLGASNLHLLWSIFCHKSFQYHGVINVVGTPNRWRITVTAADEVVPHSIGRKRWRRSTLRARAPAVERAEVLNVVQVDLRDKRTHQ